MRVTADRRHVDVTIGDSSDVHLHVVNTSDVIDGIGAHLVGLDASYVTTRPGTLPLFPDGEGRLTLSIALPPAYPAGTHPVTVALTSQTGSNSPEHVDLDLVVPPRAAVQLRARPAVKHARRRATFGLQIANRGNVPLDVALSCTDADRAVRHRFSATSLTVPAGETADVELAVKGPRHLFGGELGRSVSVHAEATVAGGTDGPASEIGSVSDDTTALLRQHPLVARGVLTILVLAAIVALWAGAFLAGLTKVFSGDPFTKSAPASFFVSQSALKGLAAATISSDVLAKGGPLPPGVGGVVAGRVRAASTGAGVGRIVVSAYRRTPHGQVLVTSSATEADGSYGVIGLFPGSYQLEFTAPGFRNLWYPKATTAAAAQSIDVTPQQVARAADVRISGLPASVSGRVDPGAARNIRVVVTARPLFGTSDTPAARTVTDAAGRYHLHGLPAPAGYQLSFTGPGYLATTVTENLAGGQSRYEPLVRLSAGAGSITGVVTDGTAPLGGVTVSANANGQVFSTITPTQGQTGRFTLAGLPTPGTYILTFRRDATTSTTSVVTLGPGQSSTIAQPIELIGGTDAVTGRVTDSSGTPLGGATVTVGGTSATLSTTSITAAGEVGLFTLSGLAAPGNYTLTATLPGYQPTTVPVTLDGVHLAGIVSIPLQSALGGITGRVQKQVDSTTFAPAVGATITATDGLHAHTTTAVDGGAFSLSKLLPGHYTVTASLDGYVQQTTIVDVVAGASTPIPVPAPGWLTLRVAVS